MIRGVSFSIPPYVSYGGPLKWFGATGSATWSNGTTTYSPMQNSELLKLQWVEIIFKQYFKKMSFLSKYVMWEMNDGFWKNKLKVNWSLFYFTVFSLIWWSLDFFFKIVVITRDNVCFSLTTWLICVYISFTDKKTMKFKGYQLNFSERLLTRYQMALKLHLLTWNVCQTDCEFFSLRWKCTCSLFAR